MPGRWRVVVAAWSLAAIVIAGGQGALGRAADGIPPSITTADRYDTRIGTLEFRNGVPTMETAERVRDALDSIELVQ